MHENEKTIITKSMAGECVISGGVFYRVIADGKDTNNRYSIMETILKKNQGAPEHIHLREDEAFFVLDGEVQFSLDDKLIIAKKDDFISCPPGQKRSFVNIQNEDARMLLFYSSAGIEEMTLKDGLKISSYNDLTNIKIGRSSQCPTLASEYGVIDFNHSGK